MWVCMNCSKRETCEFYPPDCDCGIERSWVETGVKLGKAKIVRATDCSSKAFKRFSSGDEELDRILDGGFPYGFTALVWGQPGAGKSRVAYRWASRNTPALILTLENGPAPRCYTLAKQLLEHAGGSPENVHFSNDAENWEKYANRINAKSVVVDSVSVFADPVEAMRLLAIWAAKANAFVWSISHATKANDASGLNELQHWPDATMIVKRTPYNTAKVLVKKSRFCGPGWTELPIVGGNSENKETPLMGETPIYQNSIDGN